MIKFKTPDGGYNRASIAQNPPWYQELCAAYMGTRKRYPKARTIIRRSNVIRALKRIASGKPCEGVDHERLLAVVDEQIELRKKV